MSWFKMIRLGMLHVAVAISLVPITGVLNRIMIHELGIMASVVAALIILPHLFSPIQVFIGQFSIGIRSGATAAPPTSRSAFCSALLAQR